MKKVNFLEPVTNDVCFQTTDSRRFRLRAAAIIIENDHILFASNAKETYYYSVGGAVELGETMEQAVLREVLEETGIAYEIDRLAFLHENFFKRNDGMLKGLTCHEVTFYFLMKSRGTQILNSTSVTQGVPENMNWLPIDSLGDYDIYPKFFIDKLRALKPYPEHVVTVQ